MINDRISYIDIDGEKYGLLLTTKATKEITAKFGSLGKMGEKISASEDFEKAFDDVLWLILLLANQCIEYQNLKSEEKKPLLTAEVLELLTVPGDFVEYHDAIYAAVNKGAKRNVKSASSETDGNGSEANAEESEKNTAAAE